MTSSVTPDGDLVYWAFPGSMKAETFIDFLEQLVAEASTKIIVFADHHPAHEAQSVEQWLEGLENEIELRSEGTPAFRETIRRILDRISDMSDRIQRYIKQSEIGFAFN